MDDTTGTRDIPFVEAFARPSHVVMMIAQMLLGLALAVTLILKYYFLVFGTEVCDPASVALSHAIRCTPTLEIAAHFLFGVAGFRIAAFMFTDRPRAVFGGIMVGLVGALLLFVSGLNHEGATWSIAAIIVTLASCIAALFAAQYLLRNVQSGR